MSELYRTQSFLFARNPVAIVIEYEKVTIKFNWFIIPKLTVVAIIIIILLDSFSIIDKSVQ